MLLSRSQSSNGAKAKLRNALLPRNLYMVARSQQQIVHYGVAKHNTAVDQGTVLVRLHLNSGAQSFPSGYAKWKAKLGRAPLISGVVTTFVAGLVGTYYYTHLEEVPFTNRRQFLNLSRTKLTERRRGVPPLVLQSRLLMRLNPKMVYPDDHPLTIGAKEILLRLVNAGGPSLDGIPWNLRVMVTLVSKLIAFILYFPWVLKLY